MSTSGGKGRNAKEARERSRVYQARQDYHNDRTRRRTRDNILAGVVGGVLLLGVIGAQTAYYTMGPGVPAPTSSPTPTTSPTPMNPPTPAESVSPEPQPTATETPAEPSPTPSATS